MTNALNVKPALGAAIHAIAPRWGWFVALGVGELILGGVVYATAGAIILYDPIFASLTSSLTAGVFITISGIMRVWAGFHARPAAGWAGSSPPERSPSASAPWSLRHGRPLASCSLA